MMYHGKLYGKLWDKYFDTTHTTDEWDAMEKQIAELKAEIEALKQANGVSSSEGKEPANESSSLSKQAFHFPLVICDCCGQPMTHVRPGKYQCDFPICLKSQ